MKSRGSFLFIFLIIIFLYLVRFGITIVVVWTMLVCEEPCLSPIFSTSPCQTRTFRISIPGNYYHSYFNCTYLFPKNFYFSDFSAHLLSRVIGDLKRHGFFHYRFFHPNLLIIILINCISNNRLSLFYKQFFNANANNNHFFIVHNIVTIKNRTLPSGTTPRVGVNFE